MSDTMRNQIRLFVLVILAFLPAVGLYLYANGILRERELLRSQAELVQFAHVAAVEYQRLIDESRQILGTLAEFPDIRQGPNPECNRRLADVLDHTPQYTTITLIGMDGYLACGSLTVDGGLYLGDRTYFTKANATTRFSVGDYAIGRITGMPTLGVAYPIVEPATGQIQAVLAASIDLSALGAHALRMNIPENATFTVMDRDGTILVREPAGRHPLGHDTVGASAQPSFLAMAETITEPSLVSGIDLDGLPRLFAVVSLRSNATTPEGYLLVGKEETVLLEQAEAVVAQEFKFLVSAGFVLMVMAWLFGHYALIRTTATGWEETD
jgi:hypothetical protein